jgi:hypothetical protein
MTGRPASSEYAEFYAKYVALVESEDVVADLRSQWAETKPLLDSISSERSLHRYAPGKWSIRELVLHISDAERVFAYRALRFARADQTPLPGFEQDDYIGPSAADSRDWHGIVEEFATVRAATLSLLGNLPKDAWTRTGIASGKPVSVRALAYVIAGHELHHRSILQSRYL